MVDEAIIASAGHALAKAASSPSNVFLFGSRARGQGRSDSDLDFLVIEEHVENKLAEMVRLRDALATLDVPVDIVVVSRQEAERGRLRPGSLVRRALAEGRLLVEP